MQTDGEATQVTVASTIDGLCDRLGSTDISQLRHLTSALRAELHVLQSDVQRARVEATAPAPADEACPSLDGDLLRDQLEAVTSAYVSQAGAFHRLRRQWRRLIVQDAPVEAIAALEAEAAAEADAEDADFHRAQEGLATQQRRRNEQTRQLQEALATERSRSLALQHEVARERAARESATARAEASAAEAAEAEALVASLQAAARAQAVDERKQPPLPATHRVAPRRLLSTPTRNAPPTRTAPAATTSQPKLQSSPAPSASVCSGIASNTPRCTGSPIVSGSEAAALRVQLQATKAELARMRQEAPPPPTALDHPQMRALLRQLRLRESQAAALSERLRVAEGALSDLTEREAKLGSPARESSFASLTDELHAVEVALVQRTAKAPADTQAAAQNVGTDSLATVHHRQQHVVLQTELQQERRRLRICLELQESLCREQEERIRVLEQKPSSRDEPLVAWPSPPEAESGAAWRTASEMREEARAEAAARVAAEAATRTAAEATAAAEGAARIAAEAEAESRAQTALRSAEAAEALARAQSEAKCAADATAAEAREAMLVAEAKAAAEAQARVAACGEASAAVKRADEAHAQAISRAMEEAEARTRAIRSLQAEVAARVAAEARVEAALATVAVHEASRRDSEARCAAELKVYLTLASEELRDAEEWAQAALRVGVPAVPMVEKAEDLLPLGDVELTTAAARAIPDAHASPRASATQADGGRVTKTATTPPWLRNARVALDDEEPHEPLGSPPAPASATSPTAEEPKNPFGVSLRRTQRPSACSQSGPSHSTSAPSAGESCAGVASWQAPEQSCAAAVDATAATTASAVAPVPQRLAALPLVALRARRSAAALRLQAAFMRRAARRARKDAANEPLAAITALAGEVRAAEECASSLVLQHDAAMEMAVARAGSAESALMEAVKRADESQLLCTELDAALDETRARLQATTAEWAALQAKYAQVVVDDVFAAAQQDRTTGTPGESELARGRGKVARGGKASALATRTNCL